MSWHIAEAKQSFSKLVRATKEEPQLIYNRDRLVAAVFEVETFQEFEAWRKKNRRPSVAEGAAKIRQACVEEEYLLGLPDRKNRPNPFADALDGLPR